MLLYHGTSYESFLDIIKNGFNPENKTWNCSEDNTTYFYSLEVLQDECEAISLAAQNGKIAAALQGSKKDIIIIIEYETSEEEIDLDQSCEHPPEGAVCIRNADKNRITRVL